MSEHFYKVEEIVGSSEDGIEDAIEGVIARASKTIDQYRRMADALRQEMDRRSAA